ncbi:Vacuolar protein sorting-associated protein 13 [Recurvomyces mirabilis]|uniref:Vacuolar protein sorting-associated protein 13 n=1 Tax=Recurvomyces mirabilis TaxID=574656 RepID=A0AAE1C2T5_9PEZI|nr:Vacuolar protein sorting-associated protein 13 [Recurvomyces mirabilis]KAK5153622.1 Vacuolar protein sorting-associated protein 13 [Recurvomyces mirabilis]
MLESLVANLLNRFLGMYVRNFDPKQLQVGLFSGDVTLRNLELRKEALDQFHLPINVIEGHISSLVLKIPLSNLRGQPVRINIEDVFLLAAPKEDEAYNAEEEEKRAHAVKMEKLDSAELLKERNTEGMSQEEQKKQQSFTAALTTTIIDNVQIQVKNVHIRYEDAVSDPGHPFAAGLTLQELSAVSTDENWRPTWIQSTSATTHKLATLGSLAIYWDTNAELIGQGTGAKDAKEQGISHDQILDKFRELIVKGDSPTVKEHQYILKPVSGRAGLEMDKTGKHDRPNMKARLLFNELGFVLDDEQYRDALMLVDLFHYFIRHQEYRKLQPTKPVKEDPKAWLLFAGKAVLDRIHDRNKQWSWAHIAERRDDRKKYITLFKKKKKEEKLTPDETKELDALERKLTYEDLRFWRSLARNQLRKENVGVKKEAPKSTWSSYIWGGAKKQEETHDDSQMSEKERDELYKAIDFDEKKSLTEAVDAPKEAIKLQVDMSLKTGSFTLRRDPHKKNTDILHLSFDDFSTEFVQRTDSTLVDLSLGGMRLFDGSTEGNLFEQMLKVKDAAPLPASKRVQELGDDEGDEKFEDAPEKEAEEDDEQEPFFNMSLEQNPIDGHADTAVNLKLKAMEIIYNPNFVVQVTKFFKPPEQHMESIGALMETAGSTVEGLRQQTRAGLEFALQEHKTIDLQLDLQAPLIIVPDSVTKKSDICLILDAGHASVRSNLIDKATLSDIQNKQQKQYTEKDFKNLENLMYDRFMLKLESTQLLMGTTVEDTKKQLDEDAEVRNFHLVDRLNMDFSIESCIIPKTTELTKFRINGHLPLLHAMFSDAKYKALMKLLDFAIPKFDEDKKDVAPAKTLEASKAEKANRRKSTLAANDAGRPRGKSFQTSRGELVVDEEAGEAQAKRDHDAKTGPPASTGKKAPEINPEQRTFEFKFTVDKLQGSLYKADPDGKNGDRLLVDLIAETFYLEFYQRAFDMVADVRLRALTVEDHVEDSPAPEFKDLISSEDIYAKKKEDLLTIHFFMVKPEHPEFQEKFEGIKTNLDVAVSTINLMVTRRTLLTLLDFVLDTFTSNEKPHVAEESDDDEPEEQAPAPQQQDKIRIKAELRRVAVILNNDGIRLATLSLTSASVNVFLAGKTMQVGARLDNLGLVDDINQGVSEESALRQMISIQGNELADFKYETHDPASEDYPGHDTTIFLRSGSLKINFVTEPFRKIMEFGVKFGKMQAIFNAARQAAQVQANKVQQSASRMHFDILIKTPIVAFPRMIITENPARDTLTAYLGEIYANNKFVPLEEGKSEGQTANKLSAGIRNVRLVSTFNYEGDKHEELEMLDKVGLDFNITQIEHQAGQERPDMEIEGSMSNINLRITEQQMKFAMELARNIPQAFALESEEDVAGEVEEELGEEVVEPARQIQPAGDKKKDESAVAKASHQGPELGKEEGSWTKMDLVFKVGAIGLELVSGPLEAPIGDIEAASLSKFSLNETSIKLKMLSDGGLESELLIQSFTITDTRTKERNKFRKIMSLINTEVKQQFMASVSISGGEEKNLIALLTVDSPRVIVALDYLFAVLAFVNKGLKTEEALVIEEESEAETVAEEDRESVDTDELVQRKNKEAADAEDAEQKPGMSISYRVEVIDAQVVLLANPSISNSEAIVLGTKQVLVSQQHAMTLQVEKVGMFLCRMDQFETSQLRILDDFSIQTSLDMRSQAKDSSMTSIHVDIEPLVLRLSLRDILLAMQIFQRASSMQGDQDKKLQDEGPKKIAQIKGDQPAKPAKTKSTKKTIGSTTANKVQAKSISTKKSTVGQKPQDDDQALGSAVLKREEMKIQMDGIRVVLIGDLHELPILDWSVKKFDVDVRDWTGNMTADTSIDTYFNVYNFSKSAWEPLIEPWTLGFHLAKENDKMAAELFSRKMLELTITSATIALASKSADFLSSEEDVLSKPRGSDAPYKICNYTGFEVDVWSSGEANNDDEGQAAKLQDGEEKPWRFEDPTTTRETLSPEGQSGVIGVRLQGSGFDSIDRIQVSREGEDLYNLKPRKDKVQHRMLVEIKLGMDNVKYITLRSPLLVENNTQLPIELGVYSPEEGHLLKIEKIPPGEARPAPVGAAFMHSLVVRPDQGFGYTWSNERLFWKDLLKRPMKTISCAGESDQNSPPFHFQMQAVYDKNNPLTAVYPYMRIKLSAPVEVQNLLPYDFKYRIYDKNTKKDWTNFLRKGGVSPVHVVELSHLLLMSVDMQDTPFKASEFAIINSGNNENDFRREKTLSVKDNGGLELRLKIHYFNVPDSGGAFKITVYAPYVILNRTGIELDLRSKAFFGASKSAAGNQAFVDRAEGEDGRTAKPFMFSFPTDDRRNRGLLKLGESAWSQPVSFDAIGANQDVKLPAASGRSEMHAGLHVMEGEGKYKLTKVITVTPRFVVKNRLTEDIQIREPGSTETTTLKSAELHPLRFLQQSAGQQLCLCFPGVSNKWSSPFDIANVGSVHIKLAKSGERQKLIRVEILMEGATIFLHLSLETKHWPFSMRNESDQEFLFWQANPNVDEDEEDRTSGWKPIKYRLPPRSIMPYAWNYPSTKNKNLVLGANKKERHVKLAEIGNLIPMRIAAAPGQQRQKVIDLNVVAEGPTQTLVLSNYKPSKSLYKQKSASATSSTAAGFEVKDQDIHETISAAVRFEAGIGISLVNAQLRELIYVTWRDIKLEYKESPLFQTVTLTVRWIQIDNQLYGGIFPLIFYPSVVPKTGKEMNAHPIFRSTVTRVKDDSYGVMYIKYFTFLLQQMTIEIDEDFIFALLDFTKIPGASWTEEKEGRLAPDSLDIPEPQQEQSGQDIYFELLQLQPMQFDLSFVRTERINAEDTGSSSSNPFMFAVNVLTMSIGNVNDAPIRYNALMLENARLSVGALINNIQSHYVQESLRQVHVVIGSADFLGNPVGLFNNISSGVADIFYEPYQGLVTDRPQDLGIGIAKGASSFVKKSVFGLSDSVSKFTGSISKGLAAASMDKEFQDQRRMSRSRNRPKHALYGITSGGNAFASSLASGIGGLARQPMQGAEKEGAAGFVKGVGKGLLGLATKPAIGAFDLASNMAEGVKNTTTVFDQDGLDRVRYARFIGLDGVVRPYSQRESVGQFWLKTTDNGKYFNESYIAHLELDSSSQGDRGGNGNGSSTPTTPTTPGGKNGGGKRGQQTEASMLIIITYNLIMQVRARNLTTIWDVPLKDVQTISKERTGMSIVLKGGTNGPFIPIADEMSRNWLYRQVAVAVNAYNDKWNAKG